MITYSYKNESSTVEAEFKNNVDAKQIINFINSFKDNTSYPKKLKCIINATKANFRFSYSDIKTYNRTKNEAFINYSMVYTAIIVSNPQTAALSTLYANIANTKTYEFKVFSTHEAATMWINGFGF